MALVVILMLGSTLWPGSALSAGKKKPGQVVSGPATPTASVAKPIRPVVVKTVATLPFSLPNGSRIDLSNDLNQYLQTATAQTGFFAPFEQASSAEAAGSCDQWIEVRAALSTVELNLTQLGIRVGYSLAQGETSVVQSVSGSVKATLGLMGMDFGIYQCTKRGCMAIGRTSKDHRTYSGELSFDLDFGQITTGPSLVVNTPFGKILRAMMASGMNELAASTEMVRLGWNARIRQWNPETGVAVFDQGFQSKIRLGDRFEVYAKADEVDAACGVFKAVAVIKANEVYQVATDAAVDTILDSRGIQVGDVVMIHAK